MTEVMLRIFKVTFNHTSAWFQYTDFRLHFLFIKESWKKERKKRIKQHNCFQL